MRKATAVVALGIVAAMGVAGCKKGTPPAGPAGELRAPVAVPAPAPAPMPTAPAAPTEEGAKPAGQ